MPYFPKCLRLTFEPGFHTLSEIQDLLVVQDSITEEKEETFSISSCSFTFSYPSPSPQPFLSTDIGHTRGEAGGGQGTA